MGSPTCYTAAAAAQLAQPPQNYKVQKALPRAEGQRMPMLILHTLRRARNSSKHTTPTVCLHNHV